MLLAGQLVAMIRLLAVRHGETDWNRTGRLQGWAPVGLNDRGRRQARALGADLADRDGLLADDGADRLVTSDLRRTRETAALLGEALGLPTPQPERAFRERHLGVYQGLHVDDVRERHPELDEIGTVTGLSVVPEGGESLADMAARVRAGVATLRRTTPPDETLVLVTHGGPIRVLLADATGQDLRSAVREHDPENCGTWAFDVGETLALAGAAAD